jgi:hypothetical protein
VSTHARPRVWNEDELVLALDLYLRRGLLDDTDPEVIALSRELNAWALQDPDRPGIFRNPNGVAMKLANFAALDPKYAGRGLSRFGAADRRVWERLANSPAALAARVAGIRAGRRAPQLGAPINRWWDGLPGERYWMERTSRRDLGVDLNAPQRDERGRENWRYGLIREIAESDIIVHFHEQPGSRGIVAWSRAVGECWEDDVLWAARGTSARDRNVRPYLRPGWRLGLDGPFWLEEPIDLGQLRARESELRAARRVACPRHRESLFPVPVLRASPHASSAVVSHQVPCIRSPPAQR